MKIHNDDLSIDSLAAGFSVEELSNSHAVLTRIEEKGLSDGVSMDHILAALREAIKRQTESVIYMFAQTNNLSHMMEDICSGDINGFGVYKRVGDRLIPETPDLSGHINERNMPAYLAENSVTEVFTGKIKKRFCGLYSKFDDDYQGEDYQETIHILDKEKIDFLQSLGINVRVLGQLD